MEEIEKESVMKYHVQMSCQCVRQMLIVQRNWC